MVIMEENRGYAATLGDCSADPYMCSLAAEYASPNSWYGATHPSVNNYLAFLSGATYATASPPINDECTPAPTACSTNARNLVDQLDAAGIPWRGYMEGMPSSCYPTYSSGLYAVRHNPFPYFNDIRENAAVCANVQPYPGAAGLVSALDGPNAPDFVWITPNLDDDMHNGTVAEGNAWLQANLAPVLTSTWFTRGNATVLLMMDENDAQPSGSCCGDATGGQIPNVVISARAAGHGTVAMTGSLYGDLRSIEEVYGLPLLGAAANPSNGDLSSLFG
jgi:acid phosphatase